LGLGGGGALLGFGDGGAELGWLWGRGLAALLLLVDDLDGGVEDVGDGLALDGVLHGHEHVEALALVLDQRVALADGAQADALLEVVHLVEVLAPVPVEDGQEHSALEGVEQVGAELGLAFLVGALGVVEEHVLELGMVEAVELEGLGVDLGRVELADRLEQALEVPLLGVDALGGSTR
jgi:hypothetical protein